jgi:bifunctional non-homologous end joining protein LigD
VAGTEYQRKRRFDETPEPFAAGVTGDVDPLTAPVGDRFVIQQHHATRLHHDVRLEMFNGPTPVLVSWAVPKRLPRVKGERHLAIRTEDHPIEYLDFAGDIPGGNYGAGNVRIFDTGRFEMVDRSDDRLTVRLEGERQRGVWHLVHTGEKDGKDQWLAILSAEDRPRPDPKPPPEPMLATVGRGPFDDPGWAFEPKWDGIRAISICDGSSTTLISRNRRDITAAYPELRRLHEQVAALDATIDGEIVAFEDGAPSFQALQRRMHLRDQRQIERLIREIPVTFMAFDLLYADERDLTSLSYQERRDKLESILVPSDIVQISPATIGEGVALYRAAAEQHLEGVVAKSLGSGYVPGERTRDWLKIKTSADVDVVIVGWSEGSGQRAGTIGSLVMGLYEDDELRYVGQVGTGFTQDTLADVKRRVDEMGSAPPAFDPKVLRAASELRKAHWLPPRQVAMVEYRQVTSAGRLRSPSFKGLRDDKLPEECTFDQLATARPHP